MDASTLKSILDRRPFHPLKVVTSDGRIFVVPFRTGIFFTQRDVLIGVDFAGDQIPTETRILNLADIQEVRPIAP